jgi:glutaredoxin
LHTDTNKGVEMKSSKLLFSLLILCCAASAQAQLYKWVGPDGKITYSDTPPPSSAKQVATKSISSGGPSTVGLPYELSQAVNNNPAQLYTTAKCPSCDAGRTFLNNRGIPFSEKTISTNEDIEQLRKINGGNTQLPYFTVGRNKLTGFEAGAWNDALSGAGYPATNQLPPSYRNAAAEPLAPAIPQKKPEPQQAKTDEQAPAATAPAPTEGNKPPGFRF